MSLVPIVERRKSPVRKAWLALLASLMLLAACGTSKPKLPMLAQQPAEIHFTYYARQLTPYYETMKKQFEAAHPNVTVVQGDVLKAELLAFNKVVAIPPYYLSSRLVTWLLQRQTDCVVLILQKEFADKLVAPVSTENYGWLTVVAFHDAEAELLDSVPKSMFYPPPEVDSVIVRLIPWKSAPFKVKEYEFFTRLVRWLFTQRNKKLSNSLVPFLRSTFKVGKEEAEKLARNVPFVERRARELSPREFGELADALAK